MVSTILGNKSLEKVLFFLLLNGKCYATQLSHRFQAPLTPIQHALNKLEKGRIVVSYCEGKTRFFEFNPTYSLLPELEALLKKAYSHLPAHEKKLYYSPTFPNHNKTHRSMGVHAATGQKTVEFVWERLKTVQTLCFSAKSKSIHTGWNGLGKASVEVKHSDDNTIIFYEKGSWVSEENKQFEFSNVFRWSLKPNQGIIVLEHLRFGAQHPVLLFSLVPVDTHVLESLDSHVCNEDVYFGQLRCDKHFVQFNWRVIGPKKNEEIDYLYT